jgi:DNA segregation ATPase FtsK/SpoIIIE, S-DNA-T family
LDWFKKIIHVFKEDSGKNEEDIENKRKFPIGNHNHHQESPKDLNAKIAYQYPKGSYQAQGVPKVVEKKLPRQPRKVNTQHDNSQRLGSENRVDSLQALRRFRPHTEKPNTIKKEIVPTLPINDEPPRMEQKPKKEKVRHGPFRPTEIPSPIYGYGRPKRTKVIEHELTGFIQGIESKNEETAVSLETTELTIENESLHTDPFNTNNQMVDYDDSIESISETDLIEIEKITIEENITEEVQLKIPENRIKDFPDSQPIIVSSEIQSFEDFEDITEEVKENIEEILSFGDIDEKVTISIDNQKEESLFQIDDDKEDRLNLEKEQKEETQKTGSKSHIPFNVLMLKQDIQKLTNNINRPFEPVKSAEKVEDTQAESEVPVDSVVQVDNEVHGEGEDHFDSEVLIEDEVPVEDEVEYSLNESIFEKEPVNFLLPSEDLLLPPVIQEENGEWLEAQEELLNRTLADFNVGAKVVNVTQGPSVTRFEVQPDPGVKVNKITNLQDDIKLSLAAKDIRIEAPIPGKHTIGIEVPNVASRPVLISEILNSPEFTENPSPLTAALGLDISGKPVVTDLRKMPHGLIAGATGSGKSVCINSILTSLLYKANPRDVKLLLIDPKMVELAPYNHIPHLVSPVITDVKAATGALKWAVEEMERRYELFAHTGVREISRFNDMAERAKQYSDKLPYILIVIDELADLMMVAPGDVEEAVCRIAQKARACGIHLIIATQRPSVDVITGLIKANIPTRIAFSVSSQIDSRTIIDISGAEKLLGRGDMLFLENGTSKPVRLQGTYISDTEIDRVVEHVRAQGEPEYLFEQNELIKKAQVQEEEDELFYEACEYIIEQGVASTSSLQRRFKIGYNRAARLIDLMHGNGFISEAKGSKPRDVLITEEELDSFNSSSTIN